MSALSTIPSNKIGVHRSTQIIRLLSCKRLIALLDSSLFSLNRLYVWLFRWYPYGKLSNSAFAGFFHAQIARLDTLYRYLLSVAKSSKRPNIREYSNCCRLVHHQKSIIEFREKYGSVPCAEDSDWRRNMFDLLKKKSIWEMKNYPSKPNLIVLALMGICNNIMSI